MEFFTNYFASKGYVDRIIEVVEKSTGETKFFTGSNMIGVMQRLPQDKRDQVVSILSDPEFQPDLDALMGFLADGVVNGIPEELQHLA